MRIWWSTSLAFVLAVLVWSIAGTVYFFVMTFLGKFLGYYGQDAFFPVFFNAMIGTIFGMYIASIVCNRAFAQYSRRAVAILFVIFIGLRITGELILQPIEWPKVTSYAQSLVTVISAYWIFWQGKKSSPPRYG